MKKDAPIGNEALVESLNHYKHKCRFYADGPQGEIPGLPYIFDGVVHELSHAVTLPGTIEHSDAISAFFHATPTELCDRLELTAWLVEWEIIKLFKSKFSLSKAVENAHMASKKRYSINGLYQMAKKWKEEDFVSEAADLVFSYLAHPIDEPWYESVMLPSFVWEGDE